MCPGILMNTARFEILRYTGNAEQRALEFYVIVKSAVGESYVIKDTQQSQKNVPR